MYIYRGESIEWYEISGAHISRSGILRIIVVARPLDIGPRYFPHSISLSVYTICAYALHIRAPSSHASRDTFDFLDINTNPAA